MRNYPRLCLLMFCFLFAYALYYAGMFHWIHGVVNGYGYVTVFIGGLLFSFGFTTPFGVAVFVEMAGDVNPFLAAPIAGFGAFLTDLLLFDFIRISAFHSEMQRLRASRFFQFFHTLLHHESVSEKMRQYLLWSFAGFILASPLPDEFGVSLVSGVLQVKPRIFSMMCFLCNTVGIFLILIFVAAFS